VTLARMGQPDKAIPYFQKALEIDPTYDEARKNMATVTAMIERAAGGSKERRGRGRATRACIVGPVVAYCRTALDSRAMSGGVER